MVFLQSHEPHLTLSTTTNADRSAGVDTVVRAILHGTNTGSFFGIPATGNAIRVALHGVFHVRDGRVEERIAVFDAALLRQIGVLPSQ